MSKVRKQIPACVKQDAKKIAEQLDRIDGKNNRIEAETWRKHAVANYGAKDNVSVFIEKSRAEKSIAYYINREAAKTGEMATDIGAKWQQELDNENAQAQAQKVDNKANTESRDDQILYSCESIVSKEERPVSTNVKKSMVIEENPKEKLSQAIKIATKKHDIYEYMQLTKVTKQSSVKSNDVLVHEDILDQAFDNVISGMMARGRKKKSALIGTAKDFIAAADDKNVNVFMLMGISIIESAYGTSKMALSKNNVGGLTPNGRDGITCKNVADSINIAAKTLHRNVYDKGLETINSVGMRGNYCCGTLSGRASWVYSVTKLANQIRSEYNQLLSNAQQA